MARRDTPQILNRKYELVNAAIDGRQSVSSSGLSASYGLPLADVQRILRNRGVRDDD